MITDEQHQGIRNNAELLFAWFQAYQAAGFTREEALAYICHPTVNIAQAPIPPEMSEVMSKLSAILNKDLAGE